jgi:hypothetical protein
MHRDHSTGMYRQRKNTEEEYAVKTTMHRSCPVGIPSLHFTGVAFAVALLCQPVLFSCRPFPDTRPDRNQDLVPPVFFGIRTTGPQSIELGFDEITTIVIPGLVISPDLGISSESLSGNPVRIETDPQEPGREYALEAEIRDDRGNSANIVVRFYGHNPDVPPVIINEFTTNGSDTHPDLVELRVMGSGNMTGVALCAGVRESHDSMFVFPSLHVNIGDYILVHFKPSGIDAEADETSRKDVSGGFDASPTAYDVWVKDGTGLSGNNGTISLYSSPTGMLLDGVLYSNRTSLSDSEYLGFGTIKTKQRALGLVNEGGWKTSGVTAAPEDGVNPDKSTATRSICRDKAGTDTDSKSDWHIVPTRGATFGCENSVAVYEG